MLRAVIHIRPFYIFKERREQDITDKNRYSYKSFDKVPNHSQVGESLAEKISENRGQNKEKRNRKHKTERDAEKQNHVHNVDFEGFCEPFFKF